MNINNTKKNRDYSLLEGKSIVFHMPHYFNIYEIFPYNIEILGLNLIHIAHPPFQYKTRKDKIINFFRKTFLKDKQYKERLKKQFDIDYYKGCIKDISPKSIDYVLIIRPDIVPEEKLNEIISLGKKIIAYQWDGLERYPDVFKCIPKFDVFYVFDPADYQKYKDIYPNLKLTHNFFFEDEDTIDRIEVKESVFYRGGYYPDRMEDILFLERLLSSYNIPTDIKIFFFKGEKIPKIENEKITFFQGQIDFIDYLKMVKKAKVLLDFKVKEHNGLSLRFFESLKYEKKLITNNASVVDYDFYNPNNIFILHKDSLEDLEKFIRSDYEKLPTEVVESYSFKAWLYDCLLG
ncbi:hypothetical protein [Capnocytophaga gingivalis]